MAIFSERLKMLRERAGLTQPQLAEKLGFSKGAVGNWEAGHHQPSRETMRKIASILGSTEMFLSGESEIDAGAYVEESTNYTAALPFSRMMLHELEFIFNSRQKALATATEPQKRRELLGVISEVAAELKKRIPAPTPEAEEELVNRAIKAGDKQEVK